MRKAQKQQLIDLVKTLHEAHGVIKNYVVNKQIDSTMELLSQCQETAISVGSIIEKSEGEGVVTVHYLEEYCDALFEIYNSLNTDMTGYKVYKILERRLIRVENSVKNDIKVRLEVVFLPYKISMWDSMESIWKAADEDPDCDAYVVPIPYYERKSNQTLGEYCYEGLEYPDYVHAIHYKTYNFAKRKPDVIYIHNPYDDCNLVTSVDPRFYSRELKKYTETLVYVPYFLFPGKASEHLIFTPAVLQSDLVFVQNDTVREVYENVISKYTGVPYTSKNVFAIGSPKTDKIVQCIKKGINCPTEWLPKIKNKKVIFFNTNVSLILNNGDNFAENIRRIFNIFRIYQDKFTVIWREHPLSENTIKSMRPGMEQDYVNLKKEFLENNLGILDRSNDPYAAMCISDCYFGAGGSLIPIYAITGKPMLITAYQYPEGISGNEISFENFLLSSGKRVYYNEKNINTLELFLDNISKLDDLKEKRKELVSKCSDNLDGTVGQKIYETVKQKIL